MRKFLGLAGGLTIVVAASMTPRLSFGRVEEQALGVEELSHTELKGFSPTDPVILSDGTVVIQADGNFRHSKEEKVYFFAQDGRALTKFRARTTGSGYFSRIAPLADGHTVAQESDDGMYRLYNSKGPLFESTLQLPSQEGQLAGTVKTFPVRLAGGTIAAGGEHDVVFLNADGSERNRPDGTRAAFSTTALIRFAAETSPGTLLIGSGDKLSLVSSDGVVKKEILVDADSRLLRAGDTSVLPDGSFLLAGASGITLHDADGVALAQIQHESVAGALDPVAARMGDGTVAIAPVRDGGSRFLIFLKPDGTFRKKVELEPTTSGASLLAMKDGRALVVNRFVRPEKSWLASLTNSATTPNEARPSAKMRVFDSSGTMLWERRPRENALSEPIQLSDGTLVVASDSGLNFLTPGGDLLTTYQPLPCCTFTRKIQGIEYSASAPRQVGDDTIVWATERTKTDYSLETDGKGAVSQVRSYSAPVGGAVYFLKLKRS
jgi:hypothetical protein